jgi:predicted dehydrogenase
MDEVRLGLIGAGTVAMSYHCDKWDGLTRYRVTAVCDVDAARAERAATRFAARVYATPGDLLGSGQVDGVFIFLPPFAHGDIELQAVAAGIPFFVEKPVALDLGYARQVAAAVARANLLTSVGYNWRYLETTEAAREALAGQPVALAVGQWNGGFPRVPWWRVAAQSGGQIVEQATHIADLARHLVGEVRSVSAHGFGGLMTDIEGYDVEDATAALLAFEGGAVGTLVCTDLAPAGAFQAGLTCYGRDLVVAVSTTSARVSTPRRTVEVLPGANPYLREDQAFVDAIKTGERGGIRCDYRDGARSLALTLAIRAAMASGGVEAVEAV